jgi:integrase
LHYVGWGNAIASKIQMEVRITLLLAGKRAEVAGLQSNGFARKRLKRTVGEPEPHRWCVSSMLTSCVDWEWIETNIVPAFLHRRAKRGLKQGPPRTRYLTEKEEIALLNAAKPELRQAIVLAIDTGLRREELFSLRWTQVDLDRGLITTTTRTKSGRARMVPLPARSCAVLAALARGADHVLINPVTRRRYGKMGEGLTGAQRRAAISDLCWHDLPSNCRL